MLIEEAAGTLESPIAVVCFETIEHLILVGDHQQLRGHCNDARLAIMPFFLGMYNFGLPVTCIEIWVGDHIFQRSGGNLSPNAPETCLKTHPQN